MANRHNTTKIMKVGIKIFFGEQVHFSVVYYRVKKRSLKKFKFRGVAQHNMVKNQLLVYHSTKVVRES